MSYGPGFGDPNQLAQRITSNIQKITQCYHQTVLGGPSKPIITTANMQAKWEHYYRDGDEIQIERKRPFQLQAGPLTCWRNTEELPTLDNTLLLRFRNTPEFRGTSMAAEIQRILHQLGTPQDTPELRQQLQQKQQYTNQLAKETDKYIKEFGSLPATSEQRQRKIQKDRLVGEFTTALTNFQRLQRQAAEKEKDFVARVRASSRVSGGAPEDNYKEGTLVSWDSQPQAQVQDEEITEDDLRLIEERESSIRQLEADIMDINEIFKDLGMMIHEQGDVIDSIEANVENADVHVQQANQQLSRAANYQQRSRKKMCILIIILAVGALLLGLVIWLASR